MPFSLVVVLLFVCFLFFVSFVSVFFVCQFGQSFVVLFVVVVVVFVVVAFFSPWVCFVLLFCLLLVLEPVAYTFVLVDFCSK